MKKIILSKKDLENPLSKWQEYEKEIVCPFCGKPTIEFSWEDNKAICGSCSTFLNIEYGVQEFIKLEIA